MQSWTLLPHVTSIAIYEALPALNAAARMVSVTSGTPRVSCPIWARRGCQL